MKHLHLTSSKSIDKALIFGVMRIAFLLWHPLGFSQHIICSARGIRDCNKDTTDMSLAGTNTGPLEARLFLSSQLLADKAIYFPTKRHSLTLNR